MALWLALLFSAWGATLGVAGAFTSRTDLAESGERGVHAASLFSALSIAGLGYALAVGDLTYRYVASWTSSVTPLPYRVAAVWAGPPGSLLVWALVLGIGATVAATSLPRRGSLRAWTAALLALLMLAVLMLACFDTSPFKRLPFAPDDGRGISLEWMRPVVLAQMPLGYIALALVAVPAVITVMGALGTEAWRGPARRWALVAWALLGGAMLLDWRRSYGIGAWVEDWRWAPVHAGTALAWGGATLLVAVTSWRLRTAATVTAAFAAFALGLGGLTVRRAGGWEGVHAFAGSTAGRLAGWILLGTVIVAVGALLRRMGRRAAEGLAARAAASTQLAVLLTAVALAVAGYPRATEVALAEGTRSTVTDRFGTQWVISLEGVSAVGRGDIVSSLVALRATVNGRARAFVVAELQDSYVGGSGRPVEELAVAGIGSGLAQDLRVDLRETRTAEAEATVRFVPAATWVWIAGMSAVLAALLLAAVGAPEGAAGQAAGPNPGTDADPDAAPDAAGTPEVVA